MKFRRMSDLAIAVGSLVSFAALSAIFTPVLAQPTIDSLQGLWTTGALNACPTKAYTWSGSGNDMQFRSQSGQVDAEQVIDRRPNGFITETTVSSSTAIGTKWDYRFVSANSVQVSNLSTGRKFALSRCDALNTASRTIGTTTSQAPINAVRTRPISPTIPGHTNFMNEVHGTFGGSDFTGSVFTCSSKDAFDDVRSIYKIDQSVSIRRIITDGRACRATKGRFKIIDASDKIPINDQTNWFGLLVEHSGRRNWGWIEITESRD